jgi:signal transduction histidine kinase
MSRPDIRSFRMLLLFLVLTGLPIAAFGWLGWRFLQQDRDLESQRQRERLQNASELLARELQTQLEKAERAVSGGTEASGTPSAATFFHLRLGRLVARSGTALPFYPVSAERDEHPAIFETAERQEFDGHCDAAIGTYKGLSKSTDAGVRAGALVRSARCLRKLNRDLEALETYKALLALGGTSVVGMPAALLARRERIGLLAKARNIEVVRLEQETMRGLLLEGAFVLDRGTFEFLSEDLGAVEGSIKQLPIALAADAWASRWRADGCGRIAGEFAHVTVVGVWCRSNGDDLRVLLSRSDEMLRPLQAVAEPMQVAFAIDDNDARTVWAALQAASAGVTRPLSDLDLPWRLHVFAADPEQAAAVLDRRRTLATAALALMIAVVLAAAFFVFRAVNRELEIARLQSDFISTVSHEFRTPLTAMNHLTEMLLESAVPAERVPQYYAALHRETGRLHRVVESLLDFRRFEAGRAAYRMEVMDAQDTVREVIDGFETREGSGRLRVSLDDANATIRGDREAVAVAVSNLVDNALKYSPADAPVSITVAPRGRMVGITVEDRGPGLGRHERRRVFRKFVRGAAAQEANVKGTGIGLAIVNAVVKAHGGSVDLHSVPGHGSRFTVLLPRE